MSGDNAKLIANETGDFVGSGGFSMIDEHAEDSKALQQTTARPYPGVVSSEQRVPAMMSWRLAKQEIPGEAD